MEDQIHQTKAQEEQFSVVDWRRRTSNIEEAASERGESGAQLFDRFGLDILLASRDSFDDCIERYGHSVN